MPIEAPIETGSILLKHLHASVRGLLLNGRAVLEGNTPSVHDSGRHKSNIIPAYPQIFSSYADFLNTTLPSLILNGIRLYGIDSSGIGALGLRGHLILDTRTYDKETVIKLISDLNKSSSIKFDSYSAGIVTTQWQISRRANDGWLEFFNAADANPTLRLLPSGAITIGKLSTGDKVTSYGPIVADTTWGDAMSRIQIFSRSDSGGYFEVLQYVVATATTEVLWRIGRDDNTQELKFFGGVFGGNIMTMDTGGRVGIGIDASIGAKLHVKASSATQVAQVLQAAATPTANIIEIKDSTGAVKQKTDNNFRSYTTAPATAPVDAGIGTSQITAYVDEVNHKLKFRVRYSDGTTLKTGEIPLL